jgi:TolB-like protein
LHKITGLSTSLFIRSVRLNKAFELLKEGKYSVSEISYFTGFSSPSYFSKCFHEQYGFAPGEIHKQKIAEIDQNDIFKSNDFARPIHDRQDGFGRKNLFIYGTIIAVIAIFAIIYFSYFKPSGETQIHEKSIAVLPFKNFSDKPENQYLSDGMMEAILMNISKIGDLSVISRTSVEQYRKSQKSVKQIGEELGVKHILEGSTYLDEQDIRITVQLIDSKTDQHIWSESYDTKLDNIFTIQSQIAKIIANVLHAQISAEEMKRIERIPTLNQKAYDLYQKALYYYINFLLGRQEQDYQKSRSLLSLSITEDSTFAAAYTKLADLYWMRNYRTEYHSETFMDTVFSLSQKALSYDPQSSDAHRLLGQYYFETGRSEQGITELETSISFNSNNAGSYATLGFYKNWTGDWETGIPYILKSIQLDPFSISLPMRYAYLARAYLDILDFESTFFYTRRVIEQGEGRNPALSFAYWINAHSNLVLGNSVEALKAAENINEISSMRMQAEIYCHLLTDFQNGVEFY